AMKPSPSCRPSTKSQCVVSRTLSRPQALMTVATKIALQMACKMGGELWSVEIPLKQLMIVGIDCYHDTIGGKRSIGALVASLNQSMSRKFSKCVLQHKGRKSWTDLKIALTGALKDYLKFNNSLPSRIIVYRDGVGDGQLQGVVNYEVSQIIDSIKSMGHDYVPKLSVVVVVKKRISSRFFAHINGNVYDCTVSYSISPVAPSVCKYSYKSSKLSQYIVSNCSGTFSDSILFFDIFNPRKLFAEE
uniref:Piwi domain-containing protein n=1 Tax=Anabas testudineus TaxID=64144 RepID=A0AAQ6IAV7_ANATE